MEDKSGFIFNIKKFAIHDGPGIRTTVFLTGCPLKCRWCHNPESIRDIPRSAISGRSGEISEYACEIYSVSRLEREILKDLIFYDESGGGVTFSGGEPLVQWKFLIETMRRMKQHEIHTALDTTGYTPADTIEKVIPFTDLFLFDLKIMNENEHIKYTGVSNKLILSNLEYLYNSGANVQIRIPLIPGITDTAENITETARYLTRFERIKKIDLLPYNEIAESKYKRLGITSGLNNLKTQSDEELEKIKSFFPDCFDINFRG